MTYICMKTVGKEYFQYCEVLIMQAPQSQQTDPAKTVNEVQCEWVLKVRVVNKHTHTHKYTHMSILKYHDKSSLQKSPKPHPWVLYSNGVVDTRVTKYWFRNTVYLILRLKQNKVSVSLIHHKQ